MATGPERSSILPNFAFPRSKWGIQRHMKCVSDDSTTGPSGGDSGDYKSGSLSLKFASSSVVIPWRLDEINQPNHQVRESPPESAKESCEELTKEFREAILRNKMAKSLFNKDDVEDDSEKQEKKPEELRFARSSIVIPLRLGAINQPSHQVRKSPPESANDSADLIEFRVKWIKELNENTGRDKIAKSLFNKDDVEDDAEEQEKKPEEVKPRSETRKRGRSVMEGKDRVKFSLQLSREEIEEDFMQNLGHRSQRRPKRQPRNVQNQMDDVIPGLYLTEVTPDLYKIPERKRR